MFRKAAHLNGAPPLLIFANALPGTAGSIILSKD
jgi:hypothetical protein